MIIHKQLPPSNVLDPFAWVEPWLARGGQPNAKGLAWLAQSGVATIVNLRSHDETRDVRKHAPSLRPVHIKVHNNHAGSTEQALEWLQLCAAHATGIIYIHCEAGHGRTSLFCGLVRLAQGWDLTQTIQEQREHGFDPEGKHRSARDFLADFSQRVASGALELPSLRR